MELARKGIMFTFLAIVVASMLAMIYSGHQLVLIDRNVELEKMKVTSTDIYITNLIAYTESTIRASGYLALEEMIEYIYTDGFFSDERDINNTFKELAMNGTINSVPRLAMENHTISKKMTEIINVSKEYLGINATVNITRIWIEQERPFSVEAFIEVNIGISQNGLFWNMKQNITSSISIEGLKDPTYYSIGYNNTFKKSAAVIRQFNKTGFEEFVNKSEYIVTPQLMINVTDIAEFRPMSFFGRLANSTSVKANDKLTLLSIVNPARLENEAGIPNASQPRNVSYVDFMYHAEFDYYNCLAVLKKVTNTTNRPIVDKHNLLLIFNLTGTEDIEQTTTC